MNSTPGTPPGSRPAGRRPLGRRGGVAVAFAIGATSLLGMAAMATEAGVWLTARRNAQNAADAAAVAGVYSMALRGATATGSNSVDSVARDVVTRNGFTNGTANSTVTVEIGRWASGAFTTPTPAGNSPNAVRVTVTQPQRTGLARLISSATPVAWGGAVAAVVQGGPACTLTIPPPNPNSQVAGRTNIAGSATVNAPDCLMVANATGRRSINIQNTSAAEAARIGGLRASGQCYNCADVMGGNMPAGYSSGATPTDDPYATRFSGTNEPPTSFPACSVPTYVDALGRPTAQSGAVGRGLTPVNIDNPTLSCNRASGGGQGNNRGVISIPAQQSSGNNNNNNNNPADSRLILRPGTYYFRDTDLVIGSGGSVQCVGCEIGRAGVTLVFTGSTPDNVGTVRMTSGAVFNLNAPGEGRATPSVYEGIVIYRDDFGSSTQREADRIMITGNGSSTIFGAIYAPTAHVELVGTGTMNQTPTASGGCLAVVSGEITYSGNTTTNINACESNGTKVTRISYVSLVQ
ncbi:pilus assembly protein TadG-related protein [Roseomonas rosulenta]|uniref:pilus assembly protein TadG-related protein n=1 Tax=Roseomonas rosulenta TaxID=2748667 RepID=UPI0018E02AF8|nr:pilus assembly protein TadG-related protein [Roseomonas rosulenta]